ncbi:response regulator [Fundidesulfovibrio agrisoli]|uniref:response regulator n=1 Tax=Fundidesulfovibrio agrisoli TaxID=2922717 RepID=UPI001FAC380D|nr:response regulator [Fundidesulfovibrio agrisoli]
MRVSLHGKVFLLVTALTAVTVAVALAVTGYSLKTRLVEDQEVGAAAKLKVSSLFISERDANVKERIRDTLKDQRQALRRHLSLVMSSLQQEDEELRAGIITPQQAHEAALAQAATASAVSGLTVFISDRDGKGLAHSDNTLVGKDWSGVKGGSDADQKPYQAALLERDGTGSLLLWWPTADPAAPDKHLACVEVFEPWGWHVGVSLPYDQLEARFQDYRSTMVHDIVDTLSLVQQGRTGRICLMDAKGSFLLVPPKPLREAMTAVMAQFREVTSGPDSPAHLHWSDGGQDYTAFVIHLPQLQWRLGLVMDNGELKDTALALARDQIMAIAGLFLAGMLMAWGAARWIARPINDLAGCVGSFKPRPGGLEPTRLALVDLARKHPGEIGDLARTWARTVEALDKGLSELHAAWAAQDDAARQLASSRAELLELNRELEERVQLRTAALEAANSKLRGSELRYRSLFMSSPIAFLDCDFSALADLSRTPEMAALEDYSKLMESNPDLSAECARLTRVLDANPAALELLGANNRYELLQSLHTINLPGGGQFFAALFSGLRSGAGCFSLETSFTNLMGEERHAMADARPMPGFERNFRHVLISVMDITQRKLDESRLLAAHEQAQASSRAKSDFLANMSHEIRTPISAILGLADLSQRQGDQAKTARHLRMIADSAKTLLAIIGDVLDLSRVEAGKLTLESVPFNPCETLERVLETFRGPCRDKGLALDVTLAQDIPAQLVGDHVRLGQVVSNLLGNALKFTAEGHIGLRAGVLRTTDAYVELQICVEDTGIGIPPNQLESVFDSFRQVDSTLSKRFQGAGLGLAICRELTALMGGRIWAQSAPGAGSTFCFTARFGLPGQSQQDLAPQIADTGPGQRSLSILVVEDNPMNLHVFQEFLASLGHRVAAAEDGVAALDALRRESFDLVFMDVQMPRMDGLEAVRRIRAGECGENVAQMPVIALTAYAMRGDRERFIDAGMTDYLAKPVPLGVLQELVERYSRKAAGCGGKAADQPADQFHPLMKDILVFLRERAETARRMLAVGDFDGAAQVGHDMKGTSMTFGVDEVNQLGVRLERAAHERNVDEALMAVLELYDILKKLEAQDREGR